MIPKRWPTTQEAFSPERRNVLDDTKASVWPDPETVEAMREDLERWRAKRRARQQGGEMADSAEQPA
jgi:hypothetical protein